MKMAKVALIVLKSINEPFEKYAKLWTGIELMKMANFAFLYALNLMLLHIET